jgi:hypothetical protein
VNLSAEDNGSTMNSGKADAQDGQNAGHQDANFTQKKAVDTTIALIKPSEPSGPSASAEPKTILSVEGFFRDDSDLLYEPLPEHTIKESPCYPIIDKNQKLYFCRLHPECKNVNLESVEHHCKYKDPDYHKSEILKRLSVNFAKGKI